MDEKWPDERPALVGALHDLGVAGRFELAANGAGEGT
jgi:hypothetical protein